MLIATLLAALLGEPHGCFAPTGAETLIKDRQTRIVAIGEVHGTNEAPTAFGAWVCTVSDTRPVVVGLEYEDSAQPAFEAWMSSGGTDADRRALLASTAFTRRFEDGRSSRAMLELMEHLRVLKASGRDLKVVAFRPSTPPPEGFDQNYGELAMAQALSAAAQSNPDALVMVLVGRFHASQQVVGTLRPALAHFPEKDVVSIAFEPQGGRMWSCGGDGPVPECGEKAMVGSDDSQRGVRPADSTGPFDAWLMLGPTTASPPARDALVD